MIEKMNKTNEKLPIFLRRNKINFFKRLKKTKIGPFMNKRNEKIPKSLHKHMHFYHISRMFLVQKKMYVIFNLYREKE